MADKVRVKRDGPRGWHWIASENFDPSIHELIGDEAEGAGVFDALPHVEHKPRISRPRKVKA